LRATARSKRGSLVSSVVEEPAAVMVALRPSGLTLGVLSGAARVELPLLLLLCWAEEEEEEEVCAGAAVAARATKRARAQAAGLRRRLEARGAA
jgi:hypothetical protein